MINSLHKFRFWMGASDKIPIKIHASNPRIRVRSSEPRKVFCREATVGYGRSNGSHLSFTSLLMLLLNYVAAAAAIKKPFYKKQKQQSKNTTWLARLIWKFIRQRELRR